MMIEYIFIALLLPVSLLCALLIVSMIVQAYIKIQVRRQYRQLLNDFFKALEAEEKQSAQIIEFKKKDK